MKRHYDMDKNMRKLFFKLKYWFRFIGIKTVSCLCWQGKSQSFLIYASLATNFEEKQQLWLNDLQWVPSVVWLVWQHVNGLLLTYPGCGQFGGAHFQVMLTQQRMCSLQEEWNQMMKWDQQFLLSKDWVKCECLSLSDAKPLLADLELQCDSALDQWLCSVLFAQEGATNL